MSDRVVQSFDDCGGKAKQSMHSYQSTWMAHWTRTSCSAEPQAHSHISCPFGNKKDDHNTKQYHLPSGLEIGSNFSRSDKGLGEVEARTFGIMNESLGTSSKNLGHEGLGYLPFPMFSHYRNSGSSSVSKNDQVSSQMQALRPQIVQNFEYGTAALCTSGNHCPLVLPVASHTTKTSSGDFHLQPQDMSENQDSFIGSASHNVVPFRFARGGYRFDSSRTAVPSLMCRQEEINQLSSNLASKEQLSNANLTILEHEECNYHSHSALFVCDNKIDGQHNAIKSVTPYIRQNKPSLLPNDPSTSKNQSPAFAGEQYQLLQNSSDIRLFPRQSCPPEGMLQRTPHSVHDMGTIGICTTVGSVEGLRGGPPRFSQTTHSFLITKKTDVDLCKENKNFTESTVSTQFTGKLHSLSPLFGCGLAGVKIQSLGSSTDSEGKDVKASEVALKNESSAETDTMDMDAYKEKIDLSGVDSYPSKKEITVDPNLPPQAAAMVSAGEEVKSKWHMVELPDMNSELPALPDKASSMDNEQPSTSRTQSLDLELLLSHAEQLSNSKSNHCLDGPLTPDPSSRWIKRLKLSASDALGTKSSNLGEALSNEKVNKIFSKIMKGSITDSESTPSKRHGKEVMVLDQTTGLLRNGESSSVDTTKRGQDVTLSHSWIQRWLHNQHGTPQKKPKPVVVCEPQSLKLAPDDSQKKQFPSIAAMALMGKSMISFQPFKFQKRGSFVVWNNKSSQNNRCEAISVGDED